MVTTQHTLPSVSFEVKSHVYLRVRHSFAQGVDALLSMMREMQTKVELVYDRWARVKALQQAVLSEERFVGTRSKKERYGEGGGIEVTLMRA